MTGHCEASAIKLFSRAKLNHRYARVFRYEQRIHSHIRYRCSGNTPVYVSWAPFTRHRTSIALISVPMMEEDRLCFVSMFLSVPPAMLHSQDPSYCCPTAVHHSGGCTGVDPTGSSPTRPICLGCSSPCICGQPILCNLWMSVGLHLPPTLLPPRN